MIATEQSDRFQDWVDNLGFDDLRAVASQAGIAGWMTYTLDQHRELRNVVAVSDSALAVFERTVAMP